MNICTDKPIYSKVQDKLKRSEFSERIAKYILSPGTKDGLVLSINGKWGSGKTSVANMIKESINEKKYTSESEIIPVLVNYSPWNTTSCDQIIEQFLNTLSENFVYKKVLNKLTQILKITTKLSCFLPIPFSAKLCIRKISKTFEKYKEGVKKNDGNLLELKNDVESHLKKSILRYVVFIDDLDRLNDDEIRLLIQLIKSTCNFSNITYVLLFDKDIVASALNDEQKGVNGYEYLEKIVQMEFNVPFTKHETVIEFLGNDLENLLGDKFTQDIENRLSDFLSFGLFSQITTLREEKRYLNSLSFAVESFYDQIDLIDLIVVTYLRNLDENIFKLIIEYQDWLLGDNYSLNENQEANTEKTEFFNKLKKTKYRYKKYDYLFKELFPYMFSCLPDKHGGDYLKGRIFVPSIFHNYMNMDLDYEDMPHERIAHLLKNMDGNSLSEFTKTLNPDQGRNFLYVLSGFVENLDDIDVFAHILNFLFKDFSELEYSRPFLIVGKNYYVGSICNALLHNCDLKQAISALKDSLEKGTDIGAMVCLSNYLIYKDKDRNFDFNIVDEKTTCEINKIVLEKVLHSFDIDIDSPYYNYSGIINFALLIGDSKIKELFKNKDNKWKMIFIVKSALVGSSYYGHQHNFYISFDLDLLKKVIDFESLNFDELFSITKNDCAKQRLLALKMQLSGFEPEDKQIRGFSIKEIKQYCKNNAIDFEPSDSYELSN